MLVECFFANILRGKDFVHAFFLVTITFSFFILRKTYSISISRYELTATLSITKEEQKKGKKGESQNVRASI